MSRCLGRDIVVAALLLSSTSCSEHFVRTVAESVDAEITTPVPAKIKRTKKDSIHTPGCGCTGGAGGRGAIPVPSCEQSHCSTKHSIYDSCALVVRRGDKDAESFAPCATDLPLELAVAPDGLRFATREKPLGGWSYYAGGWGGGLFRSKDGPTVFRVKEATSQPGPPDWSKVPTALAILFQHAEDSLGKLGSTEHAILREKILLNVARIDPGGLADNFAKLSPLDASSQICAVRETPWVKLAKAAEPPQQKKLVELLAPVLERDSPSAEDRRDLFHYLALVDGPELLRNVGDPTRFLAKHAATAPDASAAVLDAWSRSTPGPAAAHACKKLLSWTESQVVMAGLFAIARAKTKCPAVDEVRTLDCTVRGKRRIDLEEPLSASAVDALVKASDEWSYACDPLVGYVGALLAQAGEPPSGQTVADRCWPPRSSTSTDAADDADDADDAEGAEGADGATRDATTRD